MTMPFLPLRKKCAVYARCARSSSRRQAHGGDRDGRCPEDEGDGVNTTYHWGYVGRRRRVHLRRHPSHPEVPEGRVIVGGGDAPAPAPRGERASPRLHPAAVV